MSNSSGSSLGSIKYYPFGATRSGSVPTDKKFTGQRLDQNGLYFYNARYYDATIGRFISPDTLVQSIANPQTLNRYSYVTNNPLKYADPSGHLVQFAGQNTTYDLKGILSIMASMIFGGKMPDSISGNTQTASAVKAYVDARYAAGAAGAAGSFAAVESSTSVVASVKIDVTAVNGGYNPNMANALTGQSQVTEIAVNPYNNPNNTITKVINNLATLANSYPAPGSMQAATLADNRAGYLPGGSGPATQKLLPMGEGLWPAVEFVAMTVYVPGFGWPLAIARNIYKGIKWAVTGEAPWPLNHFIK